MKYKGVVVVVCVAWQLLAADELPSKSSSTELLDTLFQGIEERPITYLNRFRVIDIEMLLEDSPILQEQFRNLSEVQKDEVVAIIDQFNKAVVEALCLVALEDPEE
jgi:hypothetical protein